MLDEKIDNLLSACERLQYTFSTDYKVIQVEYPKRSHNDLLFQLIKKHKPAFLRRVAVRQLAREWKTVSCPTTYSLEERPPTLHPLR